MADEITPNSITNTPARQPNGSNSRKRRRTAGSEPNSGVTLRTQPTRIVTRSAARHQTALADAHTARNADNSNVGPTPTSSQPGPASQPAPTALFTFSSAALGAAPMPKSVKKKKKVVKKAAEIYRFLPREMPSDLGGLRVCIISLRQYDSTHHIRPQTESYGLTHPHFVGFIGCKRSPKRPRRQSYQRLQHSLFN